MKIVIEIPEEIYNELKMHPLFSSDMPAVERAIKNGIVLPKWHGDLVDKNKLLVEFECGIKAGNYEEGYEKYPHINDMDDCFDTVKYADAIIPADKEG